MKTKWLITLTNKHGKHYVIIGYLTFDEAGAIESMLESRPSHVFWPYAHIELLAEVDTGNAATVERLLREEGNRS